MNKHRDDMIAAWCLRLACERLADLHRCADAQREKVISNFENRYLWPVAGNSKRHAEVFCSAFKNACHALGRWQQVPQEDVARAILAQAKERWEADRYD